VLGSPITSATALHCATSCIPAGVPYCRGPQQGRKAFCLQSLPPAGSLEESGARVAAARHERQKLERLCRYISRPAIAEPRLSLTPSGAVRYQLKTPYRDGTTHVILLRASRPPPFGPAFGCSKLLPAILSSRWTSWRSWRRWYRGRG
jgi:hypothetical protein